MPRFGRGFIGRQDVGRGPLSFATAGRVGRFWQLLIGTEALSSAHAHTAIAGEMEASQFTAIHSGTLHELVVNFNHAQPVGPATSFVLGIFADSSNKPTGSPLGEATFPGPVPSSGLLNISTLSVALTEGTKYWLVIMPLGGSAEFGSGESTLHSFSTTGGYTKLESTTWETPATTGPLTFYGFGTVNWALSSSDTSASTDSASQNEIVHNRRTGADNSATTDAVSRLVSFARSISDTSTASDSVARIASHPRSISDSAVETDIASFGIHYFKNISDNAKAVDTAVSVSAHSRSVSDNAIIVDSNTGRSVTYARASADSAIATDAAVRALLHFIRSAADNSVTVDTNHRGQNFTRSTKDAIVTIDAASRLLAFTRLIADTSTATDATLVRKALHKTTADVVASVDSINRTTSHHRSASDISAETDTARRILGLFKHMADTALSVEAATRNIHFGGRTGHDNAAISDSVARIAHLHVTTGDSAHLADEARHRTFTARSAVDEATLVEAATYKRTFPRSGFDNAVTTDRVVAFLVRNMGRLVWVLGTDTLLSPFTNAQLVTNGNAFVPTTLITGQERQIIENNLKESGATFGQTEIASVNLPEPQLILNPGGAKVLNELQVYEGTLQSRGDEPDVFSYQLTSFPDSVNKPRQMTKSLV